MKSRMLPVLLAVFALTLASMACALGGELSFENPRMSKDDTGDTPVTTFAPSDTFFVVADLNNAEQGMYVEAKWYLVSAEGYEPSPIETDSGNILSVTEDSFTGMISFSLFSIDGAWPQGEYKVELYLNGALAHTLNFSVR
jgi:hypothetical protein